MRWAAHAWHPPCYLHHTARSKTISVRHLRTWEKEGKCVREIQKEGEWERQQDKQREREREREREHTCESVQVAGRAMFMISPPGIWSILNYVSDIISDYTVKTCHLHLLPLQHTNARPLRLQHACEKRHTHTSVPDQLAPAFGATLGIRCGACAGTDVGFLAGGLYIYIYTQVHI